MPDEPGDGFHADPGVLDGIASTLRNTSGRLDDFGNSMPPAADAGDASAAIANIMVQLLDGAGQLVVGTAAAGDAVARGGAEYAATDAANQDALSKAGRTRG